ncbi:MAG: hypothetical protein ABIR68_05135 [Ilumatobacteraceae bacterium]
MPDLTDLDRRIRELVARAVADAPPPPEIGDPLMVRIQPTLDRRRWWVGGTAVVLAAAAAVVTIVVVNDQPSKVTPATVPNTVVTPGSSTVPDGSPPPPTVVITTSTSTALPATVVPTSIPTSASTAPPTTSAAPTTAAATTVPQGPVAGGPTQASLVTSGPQGIRVIENQDAGRVLEQPAEIALLAPDGAVIFQTARSTAEGDPGDPQIWHADGTVDPLLEPLAPGQWYRLHDVATIGGITTVLYGVRTDGPAPADYSEALKALALDPAGHRTADLGEVNTWEGGYSRLSLSDGGTVIGTVGEQVTRGVFWAVVPGSPDVVTPPPVDTGVTSTDCDGCPDSFAISRGGERIAWTEGDVLVVRDVATGQSTSWPVPSLVGQRVHALDVFARRTGGTDVLISFGDPREATVPPPVLVATDFEGGVLETPLIGRVATFGS